MRKNNHRFFVISAAIIVLALQPAVDLAFGDTSATQPQPVAHSFISLDIPNSSGELGFRSTNIQCPGAVTRPNAQPQSINKHGEITGFCFTGGGGGSHGFFRNKKGKITLLDFPGASITEAVGINDDGQIVGDYASGGKFHGFFWDAGLFLTIDVPFPEAINTAPNGINNVGKIVGFYDDNTGGRHGFLYDRGIFTSFDFPGSRLTAPTDINDEGQIVGVYVANDDVLQSFVLENGRFTTIDVPFPGVIFTEVSGINNRGQIVGRYLTSNPGDSVNPAFNHGFIATPESEPKSKPRVLVSKPNDFSCVPRWPHAADKLSKDFRKWTRQLK